MYQNRTPKDILLDGGCYYSSTVDLFSVVFGISQEAAVELSKQFTIKQLSLATESSLTKIKGIGPSVAARIIGSFELARRLEVFIDNPKRKIGSPKDVYTLMYPKLREKKKEEFWCLYLDTKNQILKEEQISIGSLNASIVHPREVFKTAISMSTNSVIVCHNHPSGDPKPSREDILTTEKLVEGGKLLGIDVLDHVVVGDGQYTSFKDEGLIS